MFARCYLFLKGALATGFCPWKWPPTKRWHIQGFLVARAPSMLTFIDSERNAE